MEEKTPDTLLAEYITQKGEPAAEIKPDGEGYIVRVPHPERFSEEELSQLVGKPVKLEVLPYGVD